MGLGRLFARDKTREPATKLYLAVVAQARAPAFYESLGVPDTIDGRFELIALHAFLVLRRLKAGGERSRALAQAMFDEMFTDMDRSLREMGAGDLGVGRRVKAMAKAFYGRVSSYEQGLETGEGALRAALDRNLYGSLKEPLPDCAPMADYLRREAARLDAQPIDRLMAGEVMFGPPPG